MSWKQETESGLKQSVINYSRQYVNAPLSKGIYDDILTFANSWIRGEIAKSKITGGECRQGDSQEIMKGNLSFSVELSKNEEKHKFEIMIKPGDFA
ncbi:MAG: hypothetical protein ACFB14_20780 [Leptolyngbyaceae cyanobacterium]